MSKKNVILAIVIVVLIVLATYFLLSKQAVAPTPVSIQMPGEKNSQTQEAATKMPEGSSIVTYDGNGFSPNQIKIKLGTTVVFNNGSSVPMWVASAKHPTHRDYPTTGGCVGSTFDACKSINPGEEWSFKFDIAGTWKYHNHLNPAQNGVVIVE